MTFLVSLRTGLHYARLTREHHAWFVRVGGSPSRRSPDRLVRGTACPRGLGLWIWGVSYNDAFDLPDTESKVATDLLSASGTDTSGVEGGATVVWSPGNRAAPVDPATAAEVVPVLESIAARNLSPALRTPSTHAVPGSAGSVRPVRPRPDTWPPRC